MTGPSPALESIGLMVLTQSKPLGMKMRCTWRPSGRSFLSHILAPPNLHGESSGPSSLVGDGPMRRDDSA